MAEVICREEILLILTWNTEKIGEGVDGKRGTKIFTDNAKLVEEGWSLEQRAKAVKK